MGAATEGTVLVDQASSSEWVEHRTGSIRRGGLGFAPRGTKSFGNNQRLAPREVRGFSCEAKLAALGTKRARALDGKRRKLGIDFFDFGNGLPLQGGFRVGGGHDE